jgi:hypothetical protein
MATLKAEVRKGRLILDVPSDLPDGTMVELQAADVDGLEPAERRDLVEALERSIAQAESGQHRSAQEFFDALRQRH